MALTLFPDPITGQYKDRTWQELGAELQSLLTPQEYESAKRTTFNAFYTSPQVVEAVHRGLSRLGLPDNGIVLEPGCGVGRFLSVGRPGQRFIGVELDDISGRIAQALYPQHDIRLENFRDTKLSDNSLDGVIGNVPFANLQLKHRGTRYPLHDFFFVKSLDALKPGGVLGLVTSRYTLDKLNAAAREYLAEHVDFMGAIRLPSDAFKNEGTAVVSDIIFLKKRPPGEKETAKHVDDDWLQVGKTLVDGIEMPINQYFVNHPEKVLGKFSTQDSLYGGEHGYSLKSDEDFPERLEKAIESLPKLEAAIPPTRLEETPKVNFTRPPPVEKSKLTEGSFYVAEDDAILQIENGQSVPTTHGKTALFSGGTLLGERLAGLIGLRDAARLVLDSQNEGEPAEVREALRRDLNRRYDDFVAEYGPINKTTFSTNKKGHSIRRMPNLVKFRDDPDAMLVMSLEDYDEVEHTARKTAIFNEDVVGHEHDVNEVRSAEEGLLVSLDRKGTVDLPYISQLYGKSEAEIIDELDGLIYLNPESQEWETADVYLSGNVRDKLVAAQAAGPAFARHVEQLTAVQPPDVLPGEIDANLGAPWIPASDIDAFAAETFDIPAGKIRISHLAKDALWNVEAEPTVAHSVAASSDYGTSRIHGPRLLELALNLKSPVIYDTIQSPDGDQRVVNQEETLAAKEKQKLLKQRFKDWIFAEPSRTERLVKTYNDTYNNLRLRKFDGSHLEFPGMNQTISLRPHQKDAVWRIMSSGNTLLAHAVGAGKTFTMAAAGMKLKQAGIVKKPMYVVPNHMLEQFSREFMLLYPNAKLLVAGKDDVSKDRRKLLAARIASDNWDGIITTHSSFERIAMSPDYQREFLRDEIAEYENLLTEARAESSSQKHRNIIKTIEKQKASYENRLKELLAGEKKDDGLVFDELGVDHLFIDEAHFFKNLQTPTKMDRVAGIQTGGSQRAFDILMKARYLDSLHPGHGLTFATGTPISNTMVELYTSQRFLDPKGLAGGGIEHFDAWAGTFGEVVESMEISPDGASLRPRSRFAKFNNLPELQQMFRSFADVQTAAMLKLPCPRLQGDKPQTVSCPMSADQDTLQRELVDRYERVRSGGVDPRADNALAITTDGRKLALGSQMLAADAESSSDSKIRELIDQVAETWRRSSGSRGTQLIFCDLGVKRNDWGFSAYDEIIRGLRKQGIPADEIASIGEANTDAKKQALFAKVRNGTVRILLGSTAKMGTGTNVQKRLVALHHLDAPWKPAEVEQRDGRILRQGNENQEVSIYRYVTEGSFDAYMWQALETKARFIAQIMTGQATSRSAEDIGGQELSFAEVKAIASGNPAVLTLAEADAEVQRLGLLQKNYRDEQFMARRRLQELPGEIEQIAERLDQTKADYKTYAAYHHEPIAIDGQKIPQKELAAVLGRKLEQLPTHVDRVSRYELGTAYGIDFGIELYPHSRPDVYLAGTGVRRSSLSKEHQGPRAVLNALDKLGTSYVTRVAELEERLRMATQQLGDYQSRLGKPFEQQSQLQELMQLRDELRKALSGDTNSSREEDRSDGPSPAELSQRIKTLLDSQEATKPSPSLTYSSEVTAAESITTQVNKRLGTASESEPAQSSPAERDEGTDRIDDENANQQEQPPEQSAAKDRERIEPANDIATDDAIESPSSLAANPPIITPRQPIEKSTGNYRSQVAASRRQQQLSLF